MKIKDLSNNHNAWLNETKLSKDLKEAYYDRNDYYDARQGGEYGKGMTYTRSGGSSIRGYDRDDALKGQTKHLPADPFNRTTGEIPDKSNKGKVHSTAHPDEMDESTEDSPVASAITRRILMQRHDLLSKYGPVAVTQAIDDVADFVGDVEEIGSSDVSGWIKQVEQSLAGMGENVAEGSPRVDSLVTDALKIMRGSELNDAVQALKTVIGDREYNGRRGFYGFYVKQLVDMYGQQGMSESANDYRDEYNSFKG